jgi:hypothetical protein
MHREAHGVPALDANARLRRPALPLNPFFHLRVPYFFFVSLSVTASPT